MIAKFNVDGYEQVAVAGNFESSDWNVEGVALRGIWTYSESITIPKLPIGPLQT